MTQEHVSQYYADTIGGKKIKRSSLTHSHAQTRARIRARTHTHIEGRNSYKGNAAGDWLYRWRKRQKYLELPWFMHCSLLDCKILRKTSFRHIQIPKSWGWVGVVEQKETPTFKKTAFSRIQLFMLRLRPKKCFSFVSKAIPIGSVRPFLYSINRIKPIIGAS